MLRMREAVPCWAVGKPLLELGAASSSPPAEEGRVVSSDTFQFHVDVATRDFMTLP